jgi:hypothetical protein
LKKKKKKLAFGSSVLKRRKKTQTSFIKDRTCTDSCIELPRLCFKLLGFNFEQRKSLEPSNAQLENLLL